MTTKTLKLAFAESLGRRRPIEGWPGYEAIIDLPPSETPQQIVIERHGVGADPKLGMRLPIDDATEYRIRYLRAVSDQPED